MSGPVHLFRSTARVAAAALLALVCLTWLAVPAGAHGDDGEMTVVSAEQTAPMTISVEVGLVYVGDQHLAEEADVWVDASGPGTQLEPVPLERADADSAVYSGEIPVPAAGEWTLAISSETPTASATATVTVADEPATTAAPPTTAAPATTTTTTTAEVTDAETAAAVDDEDSDDGLSAVVIALGTVALLVLASAAILLWRRRAGDDPTT